MPDDCDCCGDLDDPCGPGNCTFFYDSFSALVQSRIVSRANGTTATSTFTHSASQSTTRGNDPPSWEVDTELSAASGQNGELFAIQMISDTWKPASQGKITVLRFCIDEYISTDTYYHLSDSTSTDPSVQCWFILKQDGKTYGLLVGSLRVKNVWQKQFLDGIVQDDFCEIYSGERPVGATVINPSSHPNFAITGGEISFGWAARPDGPTAQPLDTESETFSFWDNLCIRIEHDGVVVDPGSGCPPTNCSRFASSLSDVTTTSLTSALAGSAGGDSTVAIAAESVDGRNPPCIKVSASPPGAAPNPKSIAFAFVFHNTAIDLSSICGVKSVSVCIDTKYKTHTAGSTNAEVMPACRQSGKLYAATSFPFPLSSSWSGSPRGGNQQSFVEVYPAGSATGLSYYNTTSHPDFSHNGDDVEFGVVVANHSKDTTDEILLDNLCIKTIPLSQCELDYGVLFPSVTLAKVATPTVTCDQDCIDHVNSVVSSFIVMSTPINLGVCVEYEDTYTSQLDNRNTVRTRVQLLNVLGVRSVQIATDFFRDGNGLFGNGLIFDVPSMPLCGGPSLPIVANRQDGAFHPCCEWTFTVGSTGSLGVI